jgi:hypothetical protein
MLPHGIIFVARHEHADAPHAVSLLRPRRKRPRRRRAAEKRDDIAPSHFATQGHQAGYRGQTYHIWPRQCSGRRRLAPPEIPAAHARSRPGR